jgi:hypothetical protein
LCRVLPAVLVARCTLYPRKQRAATVAWRLAVRPCVLLCVPCHLFCIPSLNMRCDLSRRGTAHVIVVLSSRGSPGTFCRPVRGKRAPSMTATAMGSAKLHRTAKGVAYGLQHAECQISRPSITVACGYINPCLGRP